MQNSGAEIRKGDFTQPATLDAAYAGADTLLLVSCPSIDYAPCLASHVAAIDAAKRAGVTHVYYTSLVLPDDSRAVVMQAHLDTEVYLKKSGLAYTIVREGIYSESFPIYFGSWNPSRGREVKVPYGDGGIAYVSREDLGEGTAKLMVAVSIRRYEFCLCTFILILFPFISSRTRTRMRPSSLLALEYTPSPSSPT